MLRVAKAAGEVFLWLTAAFAVGLGVTVLAVGLLYYGYVFTH